LEFLDCSHTNIETLDSLPNKLIKLNCYKTNVECLNNLPNGLTKLECAGYIENIKEIKNTFTNLVVEILNY